MGRGKPSIVHGAFITFAAAHAVYPLVAPVEPGKRLRLMMQGRPIEYQPPAA